MASKHSLARTGALSLILSIAAAAEAGPSSAARYTQTVGEIATQAVATVNRVWSSGYCALPEQAPMVVIAGLDALKIVDLSAYGTEERSFLTAVLTTAGAKAVHLQISGDQHERPLVLVPFHNAIDQVPASLRGLAGVGIPEVSSGYCPCGTEGSYSDCAPYYYVCDRYGVQSDTNHHECGGCWTICTLYCGHGVGGLGTNYCSWCIPTPDSMPPFYWDWVAPYCQEQPLYKSPIPFDTLRVGTLLNVMTE